MASLEAEGQSQKDILKELSSRLEKDFTYDSGRIIGSMCTSPHPLAKKVYARYLEKNLGDSGLLPAVVEVEKEAIRMLGTLLSNQNASGHIVTGGTEANILALWAARNISNKNPCEVIVPVSAHCSFDKAAKLLGLKLVKVKLNAEGQVEVDAVKDAVSSATIAIVGIAGTTELGAVDPIAELSKIAQAKHLYLHVDAAFGGFVLPFLKELQPEVPEFDFSLPGVYSITVDPHKMGLAPIPSGGILFRNEELKRTVAWKISYLSGGETEQATLTGTRSGASAIAVWAVLKHLGKSGYTKIVERCMKYTRKLAEGIPRIQGLDTMAKPTMNIVGLKSHIFDVRQIAKELRAKGWAVSLFPTHIRIVVMPHVKETNVNEFLNDLEKIASRLRV